MCRYKTQYEASLAKLGPNVDLDNLKREHPEIWREKNQLSGIQMRADKETEHYGTAPCDPLVTPLHTQRSVALLLRREGHASVATPLPAPPHLPPRPIDAPPCGVNSRR